MEKKLNKLYRSKISKNFVAGLEDKLLAQYEVKRKPFLFWKYSFSGAALVLLIAAAAFFTNTLTPESGLVVRALEQYESLKNQPGIFYVKNKVTIEGEVGVESEFGRQYTYEAWFGDKNEYLVNIYGKKNVTGLTTANRESFTNDPLDNGRLEPYIYCVVDQQRNDNIIADTTLDIQMNDHSEYEISSTLFEKLDETLNYSTPESHWQENGIIPQEVLEEIKNDSDYKVELITLDGSEVYKVTYERDLDLVPDETNEMYFDKETLALKRVVSYMTDEEEGIRITVDYLEVKNVVDVDPEDTFDPEKYGLWQVYEQLNFIEEEGCMYSNGEKLSEEEMVKLLNELPQSAKDEIEKSKSTMKARLEAYPEWPKGEPWDSMSKPSYYE